MGQVRALASVTRGSGASVACLRRSDGRLSRTGRDGSVRTSWSGAPGPTCARRRRSWSGPAGAAPAARGEPGRDGTAASDGPGPGRPGAAGAGAGPLGPRVLHGASLGGTGLRHRTGLGLADRARRLHRADPQVIRARHVRAAAIAADPVQVAPRRGCAVRGPVVVVLVV